MNYWLTRVRRGGGGWICESDCNEVNGARVMPQHLLTPPTLLQKPLSIRAEDIKKPWHILFKDD